MKHLLKQFDDLSRRDFARYLAKAFLGVGLGRYAVNPLSISANEDAESALGHDGRAKHVIYLYMSGGMSHLDTLDPKSAKEIRGPVQAVKTNVDGIQLSQYLPRLAREVDKTAIIRSMHSNQGAHERGRYFMRTGYTQRGTIRHPAMGAWAMRLAGKLNPTLPGYVRIGGDSRHPGSGFMESRFAPLPIGKPSAGLQNSQLPKNMTFDEMQRRLRIASAVDSGFRARYNQKQVRSYTDAYRDAIALMKSRDLQAFDINRETAALRNEYGDNDFGQGCLLARRLVENNVRFVEVSYGGWDTHQNNFDRTRDRAAVLDQGLSALLGDLDRRGLLERTLVVVATEFGRTPKINQNNGRDHYPKAFSCLLAGGGVKQGLVYGKTDEQGAEVIEKPVTVPDFNATIAHALGLPQDEIVTSTSGRPFTVAHKGKPVLELFS